MPLRSDGLIPLLGGAYQARAQISDYEICENLFPEIAPPETESPAPVVHLPREGKRPLSAPPVQGPGRGIFTLSNGNLFGVVGSSVYFIDRDWKWNKIGQVFNVTTPVSMTDNGTNALIVDGTPNGYTINLASNVMAALADPTGTFGGSIRTDFSDTFIACATPRTNSWNVTLSNQLAWNALATANTDTTPDAIETLAFNIRQAWLFKKIGTEIWDLTGATPFPYQEWANIYIPYGIAAPYSLVQADVDLFWLSRNKQGQAIALKSHGFEAVAFSTRALEYEWSNYANVSDCIGGTFQQAGHTFVIFHFPSADRTWAYDLATKQWHRRTWIDQNGVPHREKTAFYASVGQDGGYPKTVVGQDWQTGEIYALDPTYYTDGAATPIVFRRSFPHLLQDMHFITHTSFVADFQTGGIEGVAEPQTFGPGSPWSTAWSNAFGPLAGNGKFMPPSGPALCMRYSNDGGASWSNYRQKYLVGSGHYRSMMRFRGLGMARDRVFELMWAYPGPSALQGAYIEPITHGA